MRVRPHSVSPITLVVIGGAVIVVLIVAALHPPSRRPDPAAAVGGPGAWLCPEPGPDGSRAASGDPCRLTPVDPATADPSQAGDPTRSPTPTGPPATSPASDQVRPTVRPTRPARTRKPSTPAPSPSDDGVTVACPDVKSKLPAIPAAARSEVTANLAELQQQITEADARLADLAVHPVDDPNFVQNTVLGPLKDRRIATLDRITIAIGRETTPPLNLAALAPCTLDG